MGSFVSRKSAKSVHLRRRPFATMHAGAEKERGSFCRRQFSRQPSFSLRFGHFFLDLSALFKKSSSRSVGQAAFSVCA